MTKTVLIKFVLFTGLLGFVLIWMAAGSLFTISDSLLKVVKENPSYADKLPLIPYIEEPYRYAAEQMLLTDEDQTDTIYKYVKHALINRPLFAPTWKILAELQHLRSETRDSIDSLRISASLWPTRQLFLWRLAMDQILYGQIDEALQTLKSYSYIHPRGLNEALFIAQRLKPDAQTLVDIYASPLDPEGESNETILKNFFRFALRSKNSELSKLLWSRLTEEIKQDKSISFNYLNSLIDLNQREQAVTVWLEHLGKQTAVDEIFNAGFEQPIIGGGLGWQCSQKTGYSCESDSNTFYAGEKSYRITFDGKENLSFNDFKQIIPVDSGERYLVSGFWQGREISTRSGVFIEIKPAKSKFDVRLKTKEHYGSWDWSQFLFEVNVPDGVEFIEISVRRNKTTALDSLLQGDLWIDEFEIVRKTY